MAVPHMMRPHVLVHTVRYELRGRVSAVAFRRFEVPVRVELDDVEIVDSRGTGALPPEIERPDRVGHPLDPVDEEQRATVDSDVTRVLERANQVVDVATVILGVVRLLDEHFLRTRIPGAGPVLVRPRQAEGEVRLATGQHLVETGVGAARRPLNQ